MTGVTELAKKPTPAPRAPKPLGPTREAMRHGDYVVPETRGALAVYTNRKVDMLARLHRVGAISRKQAAAGYCYAVDHECVWGSQTRDSTQPPIGGISHETEGAAASHARARARMHSVLNRIGPARYALLRSVCVYWQPLGAKRDNLTLYKLLVEALDQCAIVYGVDE